MLLPSSYLHSDRFREALKLLRKPEDESPDSPGLSRPLRNHPLRSFWMSCLVLIPCFWHGQLEAGDLGSHVYNAWLVHLIRNGHAPGLWLATRWNNVCFDFMLDGLSSVLGYAVAGKIASACVVLIFFWGAFLFVYALSRRAPWNLAPLIAMIAYGWTFEMGFMNCYLSIGLAFMALALLLEGQKWVRLVGVASLPIIWLAHPFGIMVFAGFGGHFLVARKLGSRARVALFLISVASLLALHLFIRVHFANGVVWKSEYVHDGFDQFLLFGKQYLAPARLLRAFVLVCVLHDLTLRRGDRKMLARYRVPVELFILTSLAVKMVPSFIDSSRMRHMGFLSIGFVTERLTTVMAVLFCCILSNASVKRWHLPSLSVIAILFFALLYRDTGAISRTEGQLNQTLTRLAAGQRVVGSPITFLSSNVGTEHVIDSACAGTCFSYNNYEARVAQFRVRAELGNSFVLMDPYINKGDSQIYVAKKRDLPLYEITPCAASSGTWCAISVAEGQAVKVGYKLDRNWLSVFDWRAMFVDLLLASSAVSIIAVLGVLLRRAEIASPP
jgi:hypothetical protein